MKDLYFDLISGASGDMILSSLLDVGVPVEFLRAELQKLGIPGFSFNVEKVKRSAIAASHLVMSWETPREYRQIGQILAMIGCAGYKKSVLDKCETVLTNLGKAEAKVHDMPLEKVHFHEIGAVDTIVDVAGICLALDYLGVDAIHFSALIDGRGSVVTQHGRMPVPVPAVAAMAEGFELKIVDIEAELLTPTGCAVLTALGKQEKSGPAGTVIGSGYGCGDKSFEGVPNVLRVFLLEKSGPISGGRVTVIESDMDHLSGEIMGDVAGRLMREGALDAAWTPVFMKKGRPGYRLTVLCSAEKQSVLADLILIHTRTLGVRIRQEERIMADRKAVSGTLRGEEIEEKECSYKGHSFTKPEYEALARISQRTGAPVIELLEEFLKGRS